MEDSSREVHPTSRRYASQKRVYCEDCKITFDARGYTAHLASCAKEREKTARMNASASAAAAATKTTTKRKSKKRRQREADEQAARSPKRGQRSRQDDPTPLEAPSIPQPGPSRASPTSTMFDAGLPPSDLERELPSLDLNHSTLGGHEDDPEFAPPPLLSTPSAAEQGPDVSGSEPPPPLRESPITPALDDIKVEYHQASGRRSKIYSFSEFTRDEPISAELPPEDSTPWKPFQTRSDFELAELMHEAHMNKDQSQRLLDIIKGTSPNADKITFEKVSDVDFAWKKAQLFYPLYEVKSYPVLYKSQTHTFDFHHRPLWAFFMSQRLYKYDGTEWVQFYDEPWMAESFSKAQSKIMKIDGEGKPFAIILWVDTAKLS